MDPGGQSAAPHSSLHSAGGLNPRPQSRVCRAITHPGDTSLKTLSLLAMQIAAGDNEVPGEEAVLGEPQTAKPATKGRLPNLWFRKFLSKLPGIISSQGPLTLLFVFLLTLCAERHKIPSSLVHTSPCPCVLLPPRPSPFPLSVLFLFLFLHQT